MAQVFNRSKGVKLFSGEEQYKIYFCLSFATGWRTYEIVKGITMISEGREIFLRPTI